MYDNIIALGVLLSLLFAEVTNLSPAGLIVPGYMFLSLRTPERAIYTLLVALLAYGGCRLLARYVILYGRRFFALAILLAFLIDIALGGIWDVLPGYTILPGMVGVLVPGIMANEFNKQGIFRSLGSMAIVAALIALICQIFGVQVL